MQPASPAAALKSFGGFEANGYKDGDGGPTDNSAFLTILLFDNKFQFLDVAYVSATTKNAWEYLSKTYTVKESGYAFVYASNESPTLSNVYFDDLSYTYTPTRVIQSNEYYPFGLKTNVSWTRVANSNNFLYNQGSELNDVSGLYDLPYRNYDAALGRFFQMDPMALQTVSMSSYHYAGNSPVNTNDPSGLSYPGFSTGGLSTANIEPGSFWYNWFVDDPGYHSTTGLSRGGGTDDPKKDWSNFWAYFAKRAIAGIEYNNNGRGLQGGGLEFIYDNRGGYWLDFPQGQSLHPQRNTNIFSIFYLKLIILVFLYVRC